MLITDECVLANVLTFIDYCNGNQDVRAALGLLPMLFTRPTELRTKRWDELDLESGIWNIPNQKMKERRAYRAIATSSHSITRTAKNTVAG